MLIRIIPKKRTLLSNMYKYMLIWTKKKEIVENDLTLQLHVRLWLYTILLFYRVFVNLKVTSPGWKKTTYKDLILLIFLDISKKETTVNYSTSVPICSNIENANIWQTFAYVTCNLKPLASTPKSQPNCGNWKINSLDSRHDYRKFQESRIKNTQVLRIKMRVTVSVNLLLGGPLQYMYSVHV